nr:MAG TPA: hypothetical protein [Caudoviricetes sp.]
MLLLIIIVTHIRVCVQIIAVPHIDMSGFLVRSSWLVHMIRISISMKLLGE